MVPGLLDTLSVCFLTMDKGAFVNMTNETLLTAAGLKALQDELAELKSVRRIEVAKRIKVAIELGDLSENSEYDDAKNEQAFIEGRIVELENKIRTAKIIEEADDNSKKVTLGARVLLEDVETGERFAYTVVGTAEADPFNNRISNESPVGRAILGHTVDAANPEVVVVKAPAGELKYRILPPDAE